MAIKIHSKEDFAAMKKAGQFASSVLDYIAEFVKAGVTTNELNDLCHNMIVENGHIPAPLNYRGFPKSICTSVNHVICHGIPDDRKLKKGDIVKIDVTAIVDGWHGDNCRTYFVGDVNIKAKRLTTITYEAMMKGIEQVKPGNHFGDIGHAIQTHAEKHNFSVVRDYCGHGLGKVFHDEPNVLHFGQPGTGDVIEEGMFFTIEPMVNIGKFHTKLNEKDGWTVTTRDRSLSAQFEHSIGVTKDGYEIFTKSPKNMHCPPF